MLDRPQPLPADDLGLPVTRKDLNDVYGNFFSPNRGDDGPAVTVLLVPSVVENVLTLANARWYGCKGHSMSDEMKLQMLSACRGLLKDDGYEFRRCYSNGIPTISSETLQAFKTEGAFPRSLAGVHLVMLPKRWAGIYISPTPGSNGERVAIIYDRYRQPHLGGQCDMTNAVFDQYPVLAEFTRRKVQTAFVCRELGKRLHMNVSPNAVNTTISQVLHARKIMQEVASNEEVALLRVISSFNKYTIVQHPCSKHRDVFRKVNMAELYGDGEVSWHMTDAQKEKWGSRLHEICDEGREDDPCVSTSSLENKIVIAIKNPSRIKGMAGLGIGRGGAGKGK
jgi:hypothetical protein